MDIRRARGMGTFAKFIGKSLTLIVWIVLLLVGTSQSQTTTLVSVNSAGSGSSNGSSWLASLAQFGASADGRFVVFTSEATNIVTDKPHGFGAQVYLRDLKTGTTTMVSLNRAGSAGGNGGS